MSKFRGAAAALAILLAPTVAPAQGLRRCGARRRAHRPQRPLCRFRRPRLGRRRAHGGGGPWRAGARQPVEVVGGDHQNKPDVGGALARRWMDTDRVDMIIDMPNSAVALAVQQVGRERNRIIINTSAATTELTGRQCSPVGFHWVSDSYALSHGTTRAVMRQGGRSWYFLTVDYEGGYALERGSEAVVNAEGGRVLGRARHPLNTPDFSSFLLQAQASRAQVVALANARHGHDQRHQAGRRVRADARRASGWSACSSTSTT